jgi:tetratricopeptide (TPR) repeat protein
MGKASRKRWKIEKARYARQSTAKSGFFPKPVVHMLLVFVLGLLVYSNTFNAPLVFDDIDSYIVGNPIIKNLRNFTDGSKIDTANKTIEKQFPNRIIGHLSFALNYAIHGVDVKGYHIINLAIHLINGLLVYLLVTMTFKTDFFMFSVPEDEGHNLRNKNSLFALFCALVFISHPLQTQAVTYVSQRLTSLATLFYLLSLTLYIKSRLSESVRWRYALYFGSLLSAILSMKTKEISFTLPIIVALYEFIFFSGNIKKRVLYTAPLLLTMFIIPVTLITNDSGSFGNIVASINENSKETASIARTSYLFTQFVVIVTYIRLFFVPVNQNLDYDFKIYDSFMALPVFLSFLLIAIMLSTSVFLYRRSLNQHTKVRREYRLISFGILFFFITLSVESSIIPITDVIFEHRMYLPSVGLIIAVVVVIMAISRQVKVSVRTTIIIFSVVIMILSVLAFNRNFTWGNEITLWGDTASKSPNKARPHYNLGLLYMNQKQYDKSIEGFLSTLKIEPNHARAHNNLGAVYYILGRYDEAINEYSKHLEIKPGDADAHNNLGLVYTKQEKFDEAVKQYLAAIDKKPNFAEAHINLALAYAKQGDIDKATAELKIGLKIKPSYAKVLTNLGIISIQKGKSLSQ